MVTVTGWGTTSEGALGLPNVLHEALQSSSLTTGTDTLWRTLGRPRAPSEVVPQPVTVTMLPAAVSCMGAGKAIAWTNSVHSKGSFILSRHASFEIVAAE